MVQLKLVNIMIVDTLYTTSNPTNLTANENWAMCGFGGGGGATRSEFFQHSSNPLHNRNGIGRLVHTGRRDIVSACKRFFFSFLFCQGVHIFTISSAWEITGMFTIPHYATKCFKLYETNYRSDKLKTKKNAYLSNVNHSLRSSVQWTLWPAPENNETHHTEQFAQMQAPLPSINTSKLTSYYSEP